MPSRPPSLSLIHIYLYYRLSVLPFTVPPRRERKEDIVPLANFFLERYNKKYDKNKKLSPEVQNTLTTQPWKGNVRELRNVIDRLAILSSSDIIVGTDLHLVGLGVFQSEKYSSNDDPAFVMDAQNELNPNVSMLESSSESGTIFEAYQSVERKRVLQALIESKGNKTKAAKSLGISRGKLYKLLGL